MILVLSLLLAACGGEGEPTSVETDQPVTTRAPEAAPTESEETLPDQQFSVDQEFWHSGFHIELGDGRFFATEDDLSGEISYFMSIAARFKNLGGFDTFFDGSVSLVTESGSVPALLSSELPSVPTGLSAEGEFIFAVDQEFDPESAQLLVGSSGENRAQIPLGTQGGDLITLEPTQPAISGSISMELIDLRFTSAELRADRLENYTQVEAGKLALTLYFDATSRKSGNWSIQPQNFALILPSGSSVGLDGSELASLPGSEAGTDTSDLFVRFLVDDPPTGSYTLRFTPGMWFIGEDGVEEASFEFTLE
ncbi:MAG: hypothetical protein PVG32_17385 [Anaerolineales bacterium]|jgi:hypothetical protein